MKAVLFALALIVAMPAFAHRGHRAEDCAPVWKEVTPQTGYWVYPCGPDAPVAHRACLEGEVGYFAPDNASQWGGEGSAPEVRKVCHNGTFFPDYTGEVAHRACIEGEVSYFPSENGSQWGGEGSAPEVRKVCHNGVFVSARRR